MQALVSATLKQGRLKVIAPDGQRHVFEGAAKGPEASIRITDNRVMRRMLVVPDLYLGEAYMEGTLTIEDLPLLVYPFPFLRQSMDRPVAVLQLVLLACVVGFVVAAIILPLIQMQEHLGQ